MKLFIKVKPSARIVKVKKVDATHWEVWVKEPPQEGRANMAMLKALSEHFNVPQSTIRIVSGLKSHHKVVEIKPRS